MQRLSPPSLDHHVDVDQHCMRQREHGCAAVVATAERYEATRTQGDEPRKRESSSAGSCSERTATERGARKEPKATQRRVAPRPGRGARFVKPHRLQKRSVAFCNDKARVRVLLHSAAWGEPCRMLPRASAGTFLLRLPIGRRIVLRGATLPALSVVEVDKHKTAQDLPKPDTRLRRRHAPRTGGRSFAATRANAYAPQRPKLKSRIVAVISEWYARGASSVTATAFSS